jgi:hypothetical protein
VVLVLLRPVLQRLVRPAVPLPERVRRLRVEVAVELLRR